MRNIISGLLALAWLVVAVPISAQAGKGMIAYKPGMLEATITRGETVLVFYKSTW